LNNDHTPTIVLKKGETICDRCNGSGYDPKGDDSQFFRIICQKCQGEKKVDWISNITGIKEKELPPGNIYTQQYDISSLTAAFDSDSVMIDDKPLKEYIREVLASELAERIDEEILRMFKEEREQNNKGWRQIFDNGIISKLMFFDYFKQKNKNKKNPSTI